MTESRTMLFVTDPQGNVVAAAHPGEGSVAGLTVAVNPLPGQIIHEVEVPEPLAQLTGRDFHFFVSQARFEIRTSKLIFPRLRLERHDEY